MMGKKIRIDDNCYLVLNWRDVNRLIEQLANQVEARHVQPTLVIGIFRGGMTVAHLLSDRLGITNIRGIGAKAYKQMGNRMDDVEIYQPLSLKDLSDCDVLITDDVVDSGTTYRGILDQEVAPKQPRTLCTTSLHVKPWSMYKPDIYVEETTCWICYPWETWETGKDVYRELLKRHSTEEAKQILLKQFKLKPTTVRRISELTKTSKNMT